MGFSIFLAMTLHFIGNLPTPYYSKRLVPTVVVSFFLVTTSPLHVHKQFVVKDVCEGGGGSFSTTLFKKVFPSVGKIDRHGEIYIIRGF